MPDVDALLILSFGGPEGPGDVVPFLENVLRGKNVPRERLEEVAEHYYQFGGVSPINGQCRQLIAGLQQEFAANGPALPIYWGNRNWHPMLADTLTQMRSDGVQLALGFVTSAYSSYSSCRQYLEDVERARGVVGPGAPAVSKLRPFFNHPEFIGAIVDHARQSLAQIPTARHSSTQLLFTAHSVPLAMAQGCDYQRQLQEVASLVRSELGDFPARLVYQSRSGPPSQPWLEPDINDSLRELHAAGAVTDVLVIPIGFVSDHMEVIYDLDTEASGLCRELGLNMVRACTAGSHPRFLRMVRELVLERTEAAPKRALGELGARSDECRPGCCPSGRPVK